MVFISFGYLAINKNNYKFTSDNIIENTSNYTLRANYPITANKLLNNKMKLMLMSNIKQFKEVVKENIKLEEFKDRVYDFRSDFDDYLYNDIVSFHFTVLMFTGGAHYIRSDYMYHYNYKKNKEVYLKDFFKNNDYLNTLSKLSREILINNSKEFNLNLDPKWIKEGTNPIDSNFEIFYFNEEGLNIIFPPYQVGPWSDGEIPITIPYSKLKGILK
ncbi:MAG: DUF3298 domain-containing protein [Bacilli bacterium]